MTTYASIKGRLVRLGGQGPDGWIPSNAAVPLPTADKDVLLDLQIEDDGEGNYLLVYSTRNPEVCGDFWHQTLEDAFKQAELTFGISRDEWTRS